MAAKPNFFLRVLEVMWDDSVGLCLTPQKFRNVEPNADIFNNINQQFWQYVLPGCDAWGYVACTGTNFCIRAKELARVGWFPEYTITEDYALSMELKMAGVRGRYLSEYLAVGEAPTEVRNVCRQRSRWTKVRRREGMGRGGEGGGEEIERLWPRRR
jgi:cellulose synthase/poly-beta-1,6-N-acetylglucosamine synthase-like glycosyltransferase